MTDVIVGQLCRPEAESIMVLGGENHTLHASLCESPGPLLCIQMCRVESHGICIAIPPLHIVERVQSEVNEGIRLHLLPLHLLLSRDGIHRLWGRHFLSACSQSESQEKDTKLFHKTLWVGYRDRNKTQTSCRSAGQCVPVRRAHLSP